MSEMEMNGRNLFLFALHILVLLLAFSTYFVNCWLTWLAFKTMLTIQVSFYYIIAITVVAGIVVRPMLFILEKKSKLSRLKSYLLGIPLIISCDIFVSYYSFASATLLIIGASSNTIVRIVNHGYMSVSGYGPKVFKVSRWGLKEHVPTSDATHLNWLGDHEFLGSASVGDWLIFAGMWWLIVNKVF